MSNFPVIVSYSNNGYFQFAKCMLENLNTTLEHHKVLFYCLDKEIYQKLSAINFKNIKVTFKLFTKNISSKLENYGSSQYNLITHTKMSVLKDALQKHEFIHFIDCDIICIQEPSIKHYQKYNKYDIVFQHDAGMYSTSHLHAPTLHHIWTCTGNMSLRNTSGTYYLLDRLEEYQSKYKNKNDQECLMQYFEDNNIIDIRDVEKVKLFTYEIEQYTNGYWLNNNIGNLENTYFFHANHVSGAQAKWNLLNRALPYVKKKFENQ
tara:strand:+ start:723 stop:1511 length:789 start_codon:yes stop_codon:yes gene_type:complete